MRLNLKSQVFLGSTISLIVCGFSLPSTAAPGRASDLKTQAVTDSNNLPSISFTKLNSSELAVNKSTPSSFDIAQVTSSEPTTVTQSVQTTPDPAIETQPVEPSPATPPTSTPEQFPSPEQVAPTNVTPGRSTRSGSSYVGIGANIGVLGSPSIGDTGLMLYSKIGLTRYFSIRPAVTTNFVDNATFILPATFDFAPISLGSVGGTNVSVAPYIGAGAAVDTHGNAGPLLTGGIDVPISSRLTVTAGVNAGFLNDTELGTFVGVGYNF